MSSHIEVSGSGRASAVPDVVRLRVGVRCEGDDVSAAYSFSKANAWAWLTGWGPLLPKDGGHGDLGTAVLLPRERVLDWKENGDHYFAVLTAKNLDAALPAFEELAGKAAKRMDAEIISDISAEAV